MLRIALQSKGRLNEDCLALLKEIGVNIDDSKRKFLAKASNFPVEVLFLRDDDIPQVVSCGTASLGIVGLNEVVEKDCGVEVVERLGFGGCSISLAIPTSLNKYKYGNHFLWISNGSATANQNIVVYSTPFKSKEQLKHCQKMLIYLLRTISDLIH